MPEQRVVPPVHFCSSWRDLEKVPELLSARWLSGAPANICRVVHDRKFTHARKICKGHVKPACHVLTNSCETFLNQGAECGHQQGQLNVHRMSVNRKTAPLASETKPTGALQLQDCDPFQWTTFSTLAPRFQRGSKTRIDRFYTSAQLRRLQRACCLDRTAEAGVENLMVATKLCLDRSCPGQRTTAHSRCA
jgi:hypothetical protein